MRAALLKALGAPLAVEHLEDPTPGAGEVVVDVVAAPVLPYAGDVFSGKRPYLLELPIVPGAGAIGRVRAVGADATRLTAGDWVVCDPTVRARDDALSPEIAVQGLTAGTEGGLPLQRHFKHGAFAERMRVPSECAVGLGAVPDERANAWCALLTYLVPYGGLLAAGLTAGETVLVSGATGYFGGAGVAVALAMGAGRVVAPGRNEVQLEALARRFGDRVRTVKLAGDEAADRARLQGAAGPIDVVLDLLPPAAPPAAARAAILAVRPHGRAVLMGGVGMGGGAALELPYPWLMRNCITVRGQFMCPREAVPRMVALVRGGLLSLDHFAVSAFALDDVNAAVAHAARDAAPFRLTVLRP